MSDFIIADSVAEANLFLPANSHSSDYPIYFIGSKKDTIRTGKEYERGRTDWKNDFNLPWSRTYSATTLNIFVDPSIKTNSPVEYLSDNLQTEKDSTLNFQSLFFCIKNISDSVIYMGRTFSLFFVHREAKNRTGNWIKIDRNLSEAGLCLTHQPLIILKPHELLI